MIMPIAWRDSDLAAGGVDPLGPEDGDARPSHVAAAGDFGSGGHVMGDAIAPPQETGEIVLDRPAVAATPTGADAGTAASGSIPAPQVDPSTVATAHDTHKHTPRKPEGHRPHAPHAREPRTENAPGREGRTARLAAPPRHAHAARTDEASVAKKPPEKTPALASAELQTPLDPLVFDMQFGPPGAVGRSTPQPLQPTTAHASVAPIAADDPTTSGGGIGPQAPGKTNVPAQVVGRADAADPVVRVYGMPLFAAGGPKASDLAQGRIPDCSFLSAIGAKVRCQPEAIRQAVKLVPAEGDRPEVFKVTLHQRALWGRTDNTREVTIEVTREDMMKALTFQYGNASRHDNGGGEQYGLWPAVMEVAYAKMQAKPGEPLEASLLSIGSDTMHQALLAIDGQAPTFLDPQRGLKATYDDLVKALDAKQPVGVGAVIEGDKTTFQAGQRSTDGLVDQHGYYVTRVFKNEQGRPMVELANPWGRGEGVDGTDHQVVVPLQDLLTAKDQIFVGAPPKEKGFVDTALDAVAELGHAIGSLLPKDPELQPPPPLPVVPKT